MRNLLDTYQLISDILSFKSDHAELEYHLSNENIDWEGLVKEGSHHLVLPALYCRLESKKLIHVIPEDLETYLNNITRINRARNKAIKKQALSISKLFNDNDISYVFLKGTALLIGNYFADDAERMIGDIDILIAENDLQRSFSLLQNESYIPIKQTFGYHFFEHKHLPRLTTEKYICAIELHGKLFNSYSHESLSNTNIFENKVPVTDSYIPSLRHLFLHNILNHQINDQGKLFKDINFRSVNDCLVLFVNNDVDGFNNYKKNSLIKSYINRSHLFFNDFDSILPKENNWFLKFKLKNKFFRKAWIKLLNIWSFSGELMVRLSLIVTNAHYRCAIWNDRKRIVNLLLKKLYLES